MSLGRNSKFRIFKNLNVLVQFQNVQKNATSNSFWRFGKSHVVRPPRTPRRPPRLRPHHLHPRQDVRWRRRARRRTSALPSSTGGRTRAGSSGASCAAAGGPCSPTSSATGHQQQPLRARSTRSSVRPPTARAGSR